MNLAVVNEAVTGMNGAEHEFTEEEKNFVVQFAFRSGSKEDTISLIEALAHSTDKVQSEEIMVTYRSKYDIREEPTATKIGSIPSMTAHGPPPLKLTGDCPSIAKTKDI